MAPLRSRNELRLERKTPQVLHDYAAMLGYDRPVWMSKAINRRLQAAAVPETTWRMVDYQRPLAWLRESKDDTRKLLRAMRRRTSKHGFFRDDPKPCLASEYKGDPRAEVDIWQGSYFISALLNDRCFTEIRTTGPTPVTVSNPGDHAREHLLPHFCSPDVVAEAQIVPIGSGPFAPHLGANVLAFTDDGFLKLWHQSDNNHYSQNMLIATGSGSWDIRDLRGARTIEDAAVKAMERELAEEAPGSSVRRTRLIGFWRDLERGGFPGFLGIALLADTEKALRADGREVEDRDDSAFPASSVDELQVTVTGLLAKPAKLPPSLYAALSALDQMCNEHPATLADFLAISVRGPSAGARLNP
ncbi:MAG: hypothetical protein AAF567_16660 [Actinomycetota bacterium]